MKNKLQRYYGRKELHFITFSCYERRPLLGSLQARNVFVKILWEVRERYRFLLVGYRKHWPWSSWSFYEKRENGRDSSLRSK